MLQFETLRRVRWISQDGDWFAVESSDTGIPISQVKVEQIGVKAPPLIPCATPNARGRATSFRAAQGDLPGFWGRCTFFFPEGMIEEGIEELEAYLAIFLRKMKSARYL